MCNINDDSNNKNISFLEYIKKPFNRLPIYQFWYQIYYVEMNRKISDLNHSKRIIYDDLEPYSIIYAAHFKDKVVATIRLIESEKMLNSEYSLMLQSVTKNNSIFLTKLMVSKDFRCLGLGCNLLAQAEKLANLRGKKTIILDCNDYMVPFFLKNGFYFTNITTVNSPHYGDVY
ncbi:GNAT family N-acetyltransferase [Gilliamella sp. Fer4-1]|jgi:predicted GNAT family N-acyltransferase|uniref:GNAT family N-acetyltransferase n=1 Tax=Gilliamella sp. Fer4-1 TaxID=3120242 RepID=UPI00080DE458|nr:GNAT family N-acetyltransferase [Gilliamella apicola]OCG62602.1 hypothetical protein A9G30_08865 [Gilliamella apicola]